VSCLGSRVPLRQRRTPVLELTRRSGSFGRGWRRFARWPRLLGGRSDGVPAHPARSGCVSLPARAAPPEEGWERMPEGAERPAGAAVL